MRIKTFQNLAILMVILLIYEVKGWCLRGKIYQGNSKPLVGVDFSQPSQGFVAIARQDNVNIYNQSTFELIGGIDPGGDQPQAVAFAKASGGFFAYTVNKNYARVYKTSAGFPFTQMSYSVSKTDLKLNSIGLDFNDQGDKLILCSSDKNDATQITGLSGPITVNNTVGLPGNHPGRDCQYSRDGVIGIAYQNQTSIGKGPGTFIANYAEDCNAIDFSPNKTQAIIGCNDKNAYQVLPGINNGSSFYTDSDDFNAVSYAPDGTVFFMGGKGKNVLLFYPNRTLMSKFKVDSEITTGRFDQTSSKLLVGTTAGYAYLFRKDCQIICEPSFYMTLQSKCILCNTTIGFCQQCINTTTTQLNCLSCITGYLLDSTTGKCVSCSLPGCVQCTSDNQYCLVCEMGFFMNTTTKLCERCNSYMKYCLLCTNSSNCTKCDSISYYDSVSRGCLLCQTMINRCQTCSALNVCVSCEIGYYVTSTFTCSQCPSNCIACNRSSNCQQCVNGYYLNSGSFSGTNNCLRCPTANCVNCDTDAVCLQCQTGMYLNSWNGCNQCNYSCSICNSSTSCFACINGFFLSGAACVACDTGCKTCNQSGKCLNCWQGYILNSSQNCTKCSVLYPNCSVCNVTVGCLVCNEGFFYDITSSSCLNCLKTVKNCQICKNANTCYECSIGYYLTGSAGNSSCSNCSLGCAKCISASVCESCLSTFYYSSGSCLYCVAPCITCLDATTCLSCGNGYYLDSTSKSCKICYTAIPNCLTCYNTSYCVGCQPGYYLTPTNSSCLKCPVNCTTCQSSSYCHTCEDGYYLEPTSKTCLQCQTSCAVCFSLGICSTCIPGYYLNTADYSCRQCTLPNCISCASNIVCLQCSSGTYLDNVPTSSTYNTCVLCNSIVANCILCNDNKKCTLCDYGFALAANYLSCLSCAEAVMGCVNCERINSCVTCESKFYLADVNSDGNYECAACAKGCSTCTTGTVCQSCASGFYLTSSTTCLTCPQSIPGCQICDNSTAPVQCLRCEKQYYNISSTVCSLCHESINNCLYCNDSTHCSLCEPGTYLDVPSQLCMLCADAIGDCEICSSNSTCLQCNNGYFLNSTTGLCLPCTVTLFSCLSCQGNAVCTLCGQQTYLSTTTHSCISCAKDIFGCISCTSALKCIQCDSGFYLNSTTSLCQQCQQQGCEICYQLAPLECVACNSFYTINPTTNTCILCNSLLAGCLQCQNTTGTVQCSQCSAGYYINATTGMCELCQPNSIGCVRCVDQTHCIECESLYFLSVSNTTSYCTLCSTPIPHCDICNASTQCIQCAATFFLSPSRDSCSFCSDFIPHCIYCQDQSTCILCDVEYYILNGTCKLCASSMNGCYSCTDATHCTACINGYVYDSNKTQCKAIKLIAPSPVQKILLKTYFESETLLRHVLYAQGMQFNKSTTDIQALMKQITFVLQDKALNRYNLEVKWWQLSSDQYSIAFFTNNPIDFNAILEKNSSGFKMQFRLLQTINSSTDLPDLNIQNSITVPKDLAKVLIPSLDYNSDVTVNYNLNQPQFYASLVQNNTFFDCKYYIFGYLVLGLLLVNFVIKVFFTGKGSFSYGQIIPHFVAMKTVGVAVFPGHFEMISFCKGFMLYDIPWVNGYFGSLFGSPVDYIPDGYKLFYTNLNIGSTFFLSLIILLVIIIAEKVRSNKKVHDKKESLQEEQISESSEHSQKVSKWFNQENIRLEPTKYEILYTSVFGFSLVEAGLCSFIGAINTQFPILGVDFFMHLLGSCLYFAVLLHTAYASYMNLPMYSNNLRVFLKATALTLAYLGPVYLVVVAFLVDSALIVVEYNHSAFEEVHDAKKDGKSSLNSSKKLFYVSQFITNMSLLFVYFINSHLIAFVVAILLFTISLFIELYLHYHEFKTPLKPKVKLNQVNQSGLNFVQDNQSNIFDLNKTKETFNSTGYSMGYGTGVGGRKLSHRRNSSNGQNKNQEFFKDL